ncbi:MAG: NAD(P)/FAD-dependent oxidoreductase [bacterium]
MTTPTYDVVIAGASFAGIAAAQRLRGRVLLLDKDPLGEGQTSACAAPLATVRAMGAEASVQQRHEALVLHTPGREATWRLPEPFCTFDYSRFCRDAFARTSAEFRQSAVSGRDRTRVITGGGDVESRFLLDASGWRAVLVGGPESRYVNRRWMAFGIETELPAEFPPGLHFYFLPEVRDGYAWAFPCGRTVRFGVLSYLGRTRLADGLTRLLARFNLRAADIHGGYLGSGLRAPVVDDVFIAGDASGQCLPLTGEGIRTAVLGGFKCGDLLADVLDGRNSFEDAAHAYREFAGDARRKFRALTWGNIALLLMPLRLTGAAAAFLAHPGRLRAFMRHYLGIFQPA